MARTWEYKSVEAHWNVIDDEMDALGKDGWELVALFEVTNANNTYCAQFKREALDIPKEAEEKG